MKKIIILIIMIITMGSSVAMKPYYGSLIHQWNKPFEISKGIDHYANLGKGKPMAVELSLLPKPFPPCRPAKLNEENASEETAHLEQNATQKSSPSEISASQKAVEKQEPAQTTLMEFRHLSVLAQNFMDLPYEEDLFCSSDVWNSIQSVPKHCFC